MIKTSSINKKELEKFDKISDQWWSLEGEFKILHQINPIRLSYITSKINSYFKTEFEKLSILDVGCGGGMICEPLHKLGADVTGIDALQGNIDTAISHAQKQNLDIHYIKSTIEDLEKTKTYDVVLCLEVIEHVDNLPEFASNIAQLVKPGGMLIISTINRNMKAYFLSIIMAEYILNWVPKNTHDYDKFLKPSEISKLFDEHQMNIKELKGLTFNLATQEWQLSDNIDVNYFAYLTKDTI